MQSPVIATSWGSTPAPPSSWDKGCPGKHHIGNVQGASSPIIRSLDSALILFVHQAFLVIITHPGMSYNPELNTMTCSAILALLDKDDDLLKSKA